MEKDNMALDPAFVASPSSPSVSTKGFNPGEGPQCGQAFAPENGCRECYFCGRPLHAECTAFWGDQ